MSYKNHCFTEQWRVISFSFNVPKNSMSYGHNKLSQSTNNYYPQHSKVLLTMVNMLKHLSMLYLKLYAICTVLTLTYKKSL